VQRPAPRWQPRASPRKWIYSDISERNRDPRATVRRQHVGKRAVLGGPWQQRPTQAAARCSGAQKVPQAFRRCLLRTFDPGTKVVIVAFEPMWLKYERKKSEGSCISSQATE